jgi:hypothetical protein
VKVLDLFSGTGSSTEAFRRLGHEVVTVDVLAEAGATITGSVLDPEVQHEVLARGPYGFVWASPPCTAFSVASLSRHWAPDGSPKSEAAAHGERLVLAALALVAASGAPYWVMENPRGMLRTRPCVAHLERRTVTYCRLGDTRMKPTDLWGAFPPGLLLPPPCSAGDPCHEAAPRGARTGTQGIDGARDRSRVPYALSLLLALSLTPTQGGLL